MGSFANSMFSVMLSWVRASVDWLWHFCTSEENGGLLMWISENWLTLIIILCACCMAIDFVVHVIRWRPYKVWASFFRRMTGQKGVDVYDEEEYIPSGSQPAPQRVQRQWLYADGTARREEIDQTEEYEEDVRWYQTEGAMQGRVSSADMSQQYVMQFARPEESGYPSPTQLKYQQELDKAQPVQGLEDYPQPKQSAAEQPVAAPAAGEKPISQTERIRKRMAKLNMQQFLRNDEDELNLRYKAAPPAVDKREAYGEPYYPPQWQKPGDVGASVNREE